MSTNASDGLHPAGEAVFAFPTDGGYVRLCPTDDALTAFGASFRGPRSRSSAG